MRDKALRVIWTLTGCTALALLGDATLYAVLPTNYAAVGVTAMQVGWLLSINRLARIPINLLSGRLCTHWGARWPYIVGVGVGALSTVGYALANGFAPLLALRALWGVSWALLVVAANTLVLQVSTEANRGRNSGIYTPYSFFGGALGAVLGGVLVDHLGFRPAMAILGALTGIGCALALTLPHVDPPVRTRPARTFRWDDLRGLDRRLVLVLGTIFVHRLFFAGVFYATFGYYLRSRLPNGVALGVWVMGGATLTSVLLWLKDLVTVTAGPTLGRLSDRLQDRPLVLALSLGCGVAGLLLLAFGGHILSVLVSVALVAVAYGMLPPLLVAWVGDITLAERRSSVLGVFQAMGDLGSGLGPLFAYRLVESVDIGVVYGVCAVLLLLLVLPILRARQHTAVSSGV
ncbi:MAG: MFS transporter [Chloroflexi bacterium]|nr:MFS transporter [Chloroflexota bacterium]